MENHAHTPQTLSRGLRCLPPEALLVLQARVLRHREGGGLLRSHSKVWTKPRAGTLSCSGRGLCPPGSVRS